MIGINISDPWAPLLNDVKDVEERLPGTIHSIREWFRTYEIPDGKPENKLGLKGRCMDAAYAMGVIEETHHAWQLLVTGEKDRHAEEGSIADAGVAASAVLIPAPGQEAAAAAPTGCIKRNLSYPKLNLEDLAASGEGNTL